MAKQSDVSTPKASKNIFLTSHNGTWFLIPKIEDSSDIHISFNDGYTLKFKVAEKQNVHLLRLPASINQKLAQTSEATRTAEEDFLKNLRAPAKMSASFNSNNLCFTRPVIAEVVSDFGKKRQLESGYQYRHLGTDYRATHGTPLRTIGPGKVVWLGRLSVPGKMVVIQHTDEIYSSYFHLDSYNVELGSTVESNKVIGYSGNTGRSTAPHLHLEITWMGQPIDPESFFSHSDLMCGQENVSSR